ncbi:PREDICTED: echinoderm microtubule-associated protein-like 2 [Priapulus caudatus]|uniref:Echinoderm microtubule-associated protein-like 2 n=1 Tax=Priapulus caudatus TaxID=37621 RepID=A0ABM1DXU7_PRICU|nr:PREDICTED: echinoderm microtubule-associated protein-like 2 [Priapulus caudatus]
MRSYSMNNDSMSASYSLGPVETAYWCESILEQDESSEDMISNENETLRERVADLEKKVQEQTDDIVCLRSAVADIVRRLNSMEVNRGSAVGPSSSSYGRRTNVSSPRTPSNRRGSSDAHTPSSGLYPVHRSSPRQPAGSKATSNSIKKWASSTEVSPGSGTITPSKRNGSMSMSVTNLHEASGRTSGRSSPSPYSRGRASTSGSTSNLSEAGRRSPATSPTFRGSAMFRQFSTPVKGIALHPNKLLIASGQVAGIDRREKRSGDDDERPMYLPHVRVWDSVSLHTMHIIGLGDFERAVCCIAFSKADGGQLLCAVDEANEHVLSVWDWQRGERGQKIAESKSSGDPVLAVECHPLDKNTIVTCGKGHINFWRLEPKNALTKRMGVFDKQVERPKYILCLTFDDNGNCLTGDSNGNIISWARDTHKIGKVVTKAHDGGIFSLCMCKDGAMVSGGGKDRTLVCWEVEYFNKLKSHEIPEVLGPIRTISQGKGNMLLVGTTKNNIIQGTIDLRFSLIVQGHVDELWGLAVHPNHHQFLSCGYDRQIFLWDTLTHSTIWSKDIQDGAHAACFHPSGNLVAIATLSSRWLVVDLLTREVVATHSDGNESLSCIAFSPDGRFIAVGSRDNCIYLYQVSDDGRKFTRIGRCSGHTSFVLHMDWSTDSQFLQSNSGDYEVLFWSAAVCRQITQPSSMRDVEWSTQTCTLGFNVSGIWPEGSDGTDVNSCGRGNQGKVLATGDDFGKVKLYPYPCNRPKSGCHAYGGHSSHVTNVHFLYDDTRLVSTGGKDMSIMQWQIV